MSTNDQALAYANSVAVPQQASEQHQGDDINDNTNRNHEQQGLKINLQIDESSSSRNNESEIPSEVRNMLTQTDRNGKQIPHTDHQQSKNTKKSKSFFMRFFCLCASQPAPQNISEEPVEESSLRMAVNINSPRNNNREMFAAPKRSDGRNYVLAPVEEEHRNKKCLVLDLDETLVHSSFRLTGDADYIIPVELEGLVHHVYVCKRPGVDEFLEKVSKHFEVVIYTASLDKYANPLLDLLDPQSNIHARLFRESCVFHEGSYVKDLSLLDRDLSQTIIIDNSPLSYQFHPSNAIGCTSFIDDMSDQELYAISDFLMEIKDVENVRFHCPQWQTFFEKHPAHPQTM